MHRKGAMEKAYKEIKFSLGSSIEEAVNQLLDFKNKGILVYGSFNGVLLYSDTVDIDQAYLDIIGKTRAELYAIN